VQQRYDSGLEGDVLRSIQAWDVSCGPHRRQTDPHAIVLESELVGHLAARLRAAPWDEVAAAAPRPETVAMGVHSALRLLCALFEVVHTGDATLGEAPRLRTRVLRTLLQQVRRLCSYLRLIALRYRNERCKTHTSQKLLTAIREIRFHLTTCCPDITATNDCHTCTRSHCMRLRGHLGSLFCVSLLRIARREQTSGLAPSSSCPRGHRHRRLMRSCSSQILDSDLIGPSADALIALRDAGEAAGKVRGRRGEGAAKGVWLDAAFLVLDMYMRIHHLLDAARG